MKIRVLIVDDEALARTRIRKLLGEETDLEIIGECANGPEAIAAIGDRRPDLVLLDVQMPEVSGFDVLSALPAESWPVVVFVTAHDQYAIQAFEIHALDYLLKPFTHARLLTAIERARRHLRSRDLASLNQNFADWLKASQGQPAYFSRIAVRSGSQTLFIKVEDLDYVESAANYVVLKAGNESHILRETLTSLESRLPAHLFLRISRSILVNLERIKGIQTAPRGEYLVVLNDGRQLLMTRALREIQSRLLFASEPANAASPTGVKVPSES
jgi:two-component system LytT family response regulator